MRLLSNLKCVDEPFQLEQTGSSAMPYKRNPMRDERLSSITRKSRGLIANFYDTAATQWFERTLDDSAIRRMDIPQMFLLADAMLILGNNITKRKYDPKIERPLTFYPKRLEKLLNEDLPFMTTEAILMDLVKIGYNRQEMHKIIEKNAHNTSVAMKEEGVDNDLFKRLGKDEGFPMTKEDLDSYLVDPGRYIGRAIQQTEEYLRDYVRPILDSDERKELIGKTITEINV